MTESTPPAHQIAASVRRRELSVGEVVDAALERAARADEAVNAFHEILADEARRRARELDAATAQGYDAPLLGVPVGVKDCFNTRDGHTTWGSAAFLDHRAGFDDDVVERILDAGAVLIGKTGTPEFTMSPTGENRQFGATLNPWQREHATGGSSGGSAAAVAAGAVPLALGSDGGGSIRLPAAWCGVLGFKPSRGRVPLGPVVQELYGGIVSPGPLGFDTRDCALLFDAISGPSRLGPYAAAPMQSTAIAAVDIPCPQLRVGLMPDAYEAVAVASSIAAAVRGFADQLARAGHEVTQLPTTSLAGFREPLTILDACFFQTDGIPRVHAEQRSLEQILAASEQTSHGLMNLGLRYSSADLAEARLSAQQQSMKLLRVFEDVDVILTPTAPVSAPRRPATGEAWDQFDNFWDWCQFLYPLNLAGLPAVTIPGGLDDSGLPIGIQVATLPGHENLLFSLAALAERVQPWPRAGRTNSTV